MKKTVKCSYDECWERRPHHERPDETRRHRTFEVSKNYTGRSYCSITCACLDGWYSVTEGWIRCPLNDEGKHEESGTMCKCGKEISGF